MSKNPDISFSSAYLRARIKALNLWREKLSAELSTKPENKIIQYNLSLLRNGVFPMHIHQQKEIQALLDPGDLSPLSFVELASYGTYFELYQEKVCGEEIKTTSRDFPLKIDGTRKQVESIIQSLTRDKLTHAALELEKLLEQL